MSRRSRRHWASVSAVASWVCCIWRSYRSVSSAVIPVTSKDGASAVVKLIAVTRSSAAHTKISGVRREMSDFTKSYFAENDMDSITGAIIEGKFQAELGAKLGHITDLNKVEVRKIELK